MAYYYGIYVQEEIEFEGRIIPIFNYALFNTIGDLERCPYLPKDYQYKAWNIDNDKRMYLLALDRYTDKLQRLIKS